MQLAAERPARRRRRRSCSVRCRAATSRAAAVTARDVVRGVPRGISRAGAVRRFRPATRRRRSSVCRSACATRVVAAPARPRSSSKKRRRPTDRRWRAFTSSASAAPRWRRWRRCSRRAAIDVQGSDHGVYPPMSDFLAREGIPRVRRLRAEHITTEIDRRRRRQRDLARQPRARGSARPEDPLRVAARERSATSSCGSRGRSSSPARTARRRRRR